MSQTITKPKLRGVFHLLAAFASIVFCYFLLTQAKNEMAQLASLIYSSSLLILFATSAFYHIPTWSKEKRKWLRKVDHSAIFFLIAGSYTPFILLIFPVEKQTYFLLLIWIGSMVGVLKSLFWSHAPKFIVAFICIALGWVAVLELDTFLIELGASGITLIVTGGLLYTIGGVIYAVRLPNPFPNIFGYHEIFHIMTIFAAALHAIAVYWVVAF